MKLDFHIWAILLHTRNITVEVYSVAWKQVLHQLTLELDPMGRNPHLQNKVNALNMYRNLIFLLNVEFFIIWITADILVFCCLISHTWISSKFGNKIIWGKSSGKASKYLLYDLQLNMDLSTYLLSNDHLYICALIFIVSRF